LSLSPDKQKVNSLRPLRLCGDILKGLSFCVRLRKSAVNSGQNYKYDWLVLFPEMVKVVDGAMARADGEALADGLGDKCFRFHNGLF